MSLSKLLRHRENLDQVSPVDLYMQASRALEAVIHETETNEMNRPNSSERLSRCRHKILLDIDEFNETLSEVRQEINAVIAELEPAYLSISYKLYQDMRIDGPDHILNRRLNLVPEFIDYVDNRIRRYSDWKYPGAIIRPGLEPWIENMVACDPLYVIDTHQYLFEPVKQKFNPMYVNRLRFCRITESDKAPMLNDLPDSQIGFFLAYNFFHYKPFEIFKGYLTEIYAKLDQGGYLGFSFNDCDRWGAVELVERCFMCYTPGQMVLSLCENIGYEIVEFHPIDNATSWVELKKPGQRKTLKGGQTLAEVIGKSK